MTNPPPGGQATIEFSVDAGVAELALNRPDRLNSFTTAMHTEVAEALAYVRAETAVRCLLLTGRGRGFCAGQDLADRAVAPGDARTDLGESLEQRYNPLVLALSTLEIPTVCAVNGVAAGAGANIALACDLVLAAESAVFVQAFCHLGLVPDSGGTWLLPRLVGRARATGLALLGDKLPATQAEQWGLIWRVVEDHNLLDEARSLAAHLAGRPTRGIALTKQALRASASNTLAQQLDLERDLQRIAGASDDYREGVAAFMEKRAPRFTGH